MKRLMTFLALLVLVSGCAVIRLPLSGSGEMREVTLLGEGQAKVLMVEVSGMLTFREPWTPPGFPPRESLPARVRRQLERARTDQDIKALLVRIDSPGGTVTASDVLFHEIRTFGEQTDIPVVAAIVEKGLSGGYYVALAADEIIAHPTALVGSVGVYVTAFDLSELLRDWGVHTRTIKSGPQKDILSPLRPLRPEEQETLDRLIRELAQRFEDTVRMARVDLGEGDMEVLRTAAPFTASRALELHMIDRVGYMRDAFSAAMSLAGLDAARLVAYRTSSRAEGAGPYAWGAVASLEAAQRTPLYVDPAWLKELTDRRFRY